MPRTADSPWPATSAGTFHTTQWSIILAAGDKDGPETDAALAYLCQTYWLPVYAFIRSWGHGQADAQDLTQSFFADILENKTFRKADQEKGTFRVYLLGGLKYFLANERKKNRAQKRGGQHRHVSMDTEHAENELSSDLSQSITPAVLFDRRWALQLLEEATQELRSEYCRKGKSKHFEVIHPYITRSAGESCSGNAIELGISVPAFRMAAHRLRQRFAQTLRMKAAETVEKNTDLEEEIRYLKSTLWQESLG